MFSEFYLTVSSYEAENYAWQATSSIVTVAGAGQVAEWCCGVHTAHLLPQGGPRRCCQVRERDRSHLIKKLGATFTGQNIRDHDMS